MRRCRRKTRKKTTARSRLADALRTVDRERKVLAYCKRVGRDLTDWEFRAVYGRRRDGRKRTPRREHQITMRDIKRLRARVLETPKRRRGH